MGWNPNAVVPRTTSVVAHDAGVDAAKWLLNCLEQDELDRRLLLMEWVKLSSRATCINRTTGFG